jgi:hypothetical protein
VRGLHETIDNSEGCSWDMICCAEDVLGLLDVGKGTVDVMSNDDWWLIGGQDADAGCLSS